MKKLMIALAAVAYGVAVAAEGIESSNVVGYVTPTTDKESFSMTPMFIPVSGFKTTYQLKDFKATGMTYDMDSIQFLDPDTTECYLQAVYLSEDEFPGMEGWWDFTGGYGDDDRLDENEFAYGTSFLAMFASGNEIQFECAGAVIDEEKTFSYAHESDFFGNYLPRTLKFGEMSASGMVYDMDSLQFLDPDTTECYLQAVYLDEAEFPDMGGWWDFTGGYGDDDKLDEMDIPAGQAFLAMFASGNEVAITFPAGVTAKK